MAGESVDAVLHAQIARRVRRRWIGVWICVAAAALFGAGVYYAQRLMHGDGYTVAEGRIVGLGTGSSGEPTFTSEFHDADGVLHRDTETYGYHYAPGDPRLGQRVRFLYRTGPITGSLDAFPAADVILHWMFGVPALGFAAFAALLAGLIAREARYRRWLVAHGRRELLEQPAIGERALALPAGGGGSQVVRNWRLEGRYFLPAAGEYVEAHGDWEPPPARELRAGDAPLLLLDPRDPARYWLPSGAP